MLVGIKQNFLNEIANLEIYVHVDEDIDEKRT